MLQSMNAKDVTVDQPYLVAVFEAVALPLASQSWGKFTDWRGAQPYPAPSDLHQMAYWLTVARPMVGCVAGWTPWYGIIDDDLVAAAVSGLLAGVWLGVFLPAGFVFLPASRRMAKVRWGHVARIALYSAFLPALTSWLLAIIVIASAFNWSSRGTLTGLGFFFAWPALLVGLNIWWAVAIKRYLRMPHGWAITPLLSIVVMMLPAVVFFYAGAISPGIILLFMLLAVLLGGGIALIVALQTRRAIILPRSKGEDTGGG